MEAMFRRCIEEDRGQGRTVLLSSHILAEAEALCDRVSIMRHGRIVESGTLTELRHLTRTSVTAEVDSEPAGLAARVGVHALDVSRTPSGTTLVRCQVDSDQLGGMIQALSAAGIRSLTSQPPTLEELFLRHYSDQVPEAGQTSDGGRAAAANGGSPS